jgi:hypothetical protein
MQYEIIDWGNSCDSKKVFTLWNKIVRILMGIQSHNSCRDLFKRLELLTLPCVYIFSLINVITNNKQFQTKADVNSVNTRCKHYLPKPTANLSYFQKSAYYAGIKIFSNLPSDLESLMNEKILIKVALKLYLNPRSFYKYSVNEYLLSKKWLIHFKVG